MGAEQLLRKRRDQLHRRLGYVYVTSMAINTLTALTIYKFTGGFNIFHALALYSLFCITMALRPMLATPRPLNWRSMHYQWVSWSYVGLCAAAATEFCVRVLFMEGWFASIVATIPVVVGGWFLINRLAPPRTAAPTG